MLNIVQLFAALLMLAGASFLGGLFLRALHRRVSMARWPRVNGIVRAQRVHSHRNLHGAGHHRPVVTVQYASSGRQRLVHCDSPTRMGFAQKDKAHATLDQFPVGTPVKLYVDPKNPERAFLYLPEISALLMLGLGALFLLLVGVGMWGPAWRGLGSV